MGRHGRVVGEFNIDPMWSGKFQSSWHCLPRRMTPLEVVGPPPPCTYLPRSHYVCTIPYYDERSPLVDVSSRISLPWSTVAVLLSLSFTTVNDNSLPSTVN